MRLLSVTIFILLATVVLNVQAQQKSKAQSSQATNIEAKVEQNSIAKSSVHTTLAYAEVFAQKVETEADLKVLSVDMAEGAPQILEKKLFRDFLQREIEWLEKLPPASHPKMTLAFGKMIVRKVQAEVDQKMLADNYADSHPLIKKARARFTIYQDEINKLLQ
jgi:hypothetical protein